MYVMEKRIRSISISFLLILIATLYTLLVKLIDVNNIGPNGSEVGFATLNNFVFNLTSENKIWYKITEILAIIPIFMVLVYGFIGLRELIKRKSLFKVDRELLGLGVFYIIILAIYIFFEVVIINYRPVLMDGVLEASYPSSHTLLALCICGSAILLNKKRFNEIKITKYINIVLIITMVLLVIGRLLSGVHWFSDILGSIIISIALLYSYYVFLRLR